MEKYSNVRENDKIIFKNLLDNTKLEVMHYDEEYAFDQIFINEKYDLDFIEYVIQKLKETKDIAGLYSEYDSLKLEELLYKNGLRVSNYQYTIKYSKNFESSNYEISDTLDQDGKEYYLKMINKSLRDNHQYIAPNRQYQEYTEKWFENEEIEKFNYSIYRKNDQIIGIVEYFDNDYNGVESPKTYLDWNNKLCIRSIFSEDEQVLEDMIKDLLNIYKKDIIIHITYNDKTLKNVVNKLDSKFDVCLYVLVEKDN